MSFSKIKKSSFSALSQPCWTQRQDKSEPPREHLSVRQAKMWMGYSLTADLNSRLRWDPALRRVGARVKGYVFWLSKPSDEIIAQVRALPHINLYSQSLRGRPPGTPVWCCVAGEAATEKDIMVLDSMSSLSRYLGVGPAWVCLKLRSGRQVKTPLGLPAVEIRNQDKVLHWVGHATHPLTETHKILRVAPDSNSATLSPQEYESLPAPSIPSTLSGLVAGEVSAPRPAPETALAENVLTPEEESESVPASDDDLSVG